MNTEITENNYSKHSKEQLFQKIKELQSDLSGEIYEKEKLQDYIDSIIDNSPTAIMIIDAPDGNISYINDAVWDFRGDTDAKMTGISVVEYVNTWKEFYPDGRQYKGEEMPVARSLLHGEVIKGEELIVELEDGTRKWASAWSNPIKNKTGEVLGALLLFYDVTEKKNYEHELIEAKNRAVMANKAKSVFLTNMSHELRTPLNAILGYAQILLKRDLTSELIEGLETIQQGGEHLLTLINDILDTAKIEADKVVLSPEPVRLEPFLETIMTIIGSHAETKGVKVRLQTPEPLPAGVIVDTTRLRQVLLNLLSNGIKFTDNGEVKLRVSRQDTELLPDAVVLRFEVKDTGVGIDPDHVERIFYPFEQISDPARDSGGSGLGLHISQQLVALMGGELTVDSKPGLGSTFAFKITVPEHLVEMDDTVSDDRTIIGFNGPRCQVLVVDDLAINRAVLSGMLTPIGFEVIEAVDGRQAIMMAQKNPPDLILMDRYMPVTDGLTAIVELRQVPELMKVPAIAISASVAEEDRRELLEAGFDGFVPKPVHWSSLLELLQTHLKLEWQYGDQEETSDVDFNTGPLVPPPREELARLQELALVGDMEAIISRADSIGRLDKKYSAFTRELKKLAETFEDQRIQKLLRQYIETAQ